MYLASLYLKDFRNYSEDLVQFSEGKNLVLGKNGEGKTNLLEAIYMLSTSKSFRHLSDQKIKRWGTGGYVIRGEFRTEKGNYELILEYTGEKKQFYVDRVPEQKLANIIGYVYCVLFSFDDISVITGPPVFRRQYLDLILSTVDPLYFSNLRIYLQLLKHKNRYLKDAIGIDENLIETLDEQMVHSGAYIVQKRSSFIRFLDRFINEVSGRIDQFSLPLRLVYRSNVLRDENPGSPSGVQALYREELRRRRTTEIKLVQALVGPHRDELAFYDKSSEIRYFGSIGEARLTCILLRLAQASFYIQYTGCLPILLIDDILLELDSSNREKALELFDGENQMIITTTERMRLPEIFSCNRVFYITEKGRIEWREKETPCQ